MDALCSFVGGPGSMSRNSFGSKRSEVKKTTRKREVLCEIWDHPTKAFPTRWWLLLPRKFQYSFFFSKQKEKNILLDCNSSSYVFNDVREYKCCETCNTRRRRTDRLRPGILHSGWKRTRETCTKSRHKRILIPLKYPPRRFVIHSPSPIAMLENEIKRWKQHYCNLRELRERYFQMQLIILFLFGVREWETEEMREKGGINAA